MFNWMGMEGYLKFATWSLVLKKAVELVYFDDSSSILKWQGSGSASDLFYWTIIFFGFQSSFGYTQKILFSSSGFVDLQTYF